MALGSGDQRLRNFLGMGEQRLKCRRYYAHVLSDLHPRARITQTFGPKGALRYTGRTA